MKKLFWFTAFGLALSLAWLSRAASKPADLSFSCLGVLDCYDEGWATIQTAYGQEWLLPIGGDNLVEGGVFHITLELIPDERLYQEQMAKASQLLLALLD